MEIIEFFACLHCFLTFFLYPLLPVDTLLQAQRNKITVLTNLKPSNYCPDRKCAHYCCDCKGFMQRKKKKKTCNQQPQSEEDEGNR